jgi:lysozyme family protein
MGAIVAIDQDKVIADTIDREGGEKYTNRPDDRGGPTRWGLTTVAAADVGYTGPMETCPKEVAIAFYKKLWTKLRIDDVAKRSIPLALYMYDFGVVSGSGRAVREFQELLNVLNVKETLFPDVGVDGGMGKEVLGAMDEYAKKASIAVLADSYNAMRIAFCVNLAKKDKSQESNVRGWLNRIYNVGKSAYGTVGIS